MVYLLPPPGRGILVALFTIPINRHGWVLFTNCANVLQHLVQDFLTCVVCEVEGEGSRSGSALRSRLPFVELFDVHVRALILPNLEENPICESFFRVSALVEPSCVSGTCCRRQLGSPFRTKSVPRFDESGVSRECLEYQKV